MRNHGRAHGTRTVHRYRFRAASDATSAVRSSRVTRSTFTRSSQPITRETSQSTFWFATSGVGDAGRTSVKTWSERI